MVPDIGPIILQIVLIALNAIFASAEIAVVTMGETKIEKLAEEGNKKAKKLKKLTKNQSKFLATIQVAITLAGFLGSAFAADSFAPPLAEWLYYSGVSFIGQEALEKLVLVFITVIISYFSIVVGELVPKKIAINNAEKTALGLAGILNFVSCIFAPLVWMLTSSTNGILRLFGVDPNKEEEVTEDEIKLMVSAGEEKGTIDSEESEMIQNIFDFNDTSVDEIFTHRTEVETLYLDDSLEDWDKVIYSTRFNYYPLCGENSDDIIGILDSKEYLRMQIEDRTRENILKNALKKPSFVPESVKADILFRKMQESGLHFAITVDEYGGMSGIVTMRDLLQIIVGELVEEDEIVKDETIESVGENLWKIRGEATLDEVSEALGYEFDEEITEDYDTFGGYICGALGEVPDDGADFTIEAGELSVHVTVVKTRRIEETIVTYIPPVDEDDEDEKDSEKEKDKEKDKDKDKEKDTEKVK